MEEEKKAIDRGSWVIDIETIVGIFTYIGYNIDTKEIVKYVLHKDRFELNELLEHLKQCKGHITFNGNNFDYPIIHMILTNYLDWLDLTNQEVINIIYRKAQWIIEQGRNRQQGVFTSIPEKETLIKQLDLFLVWHYNNKARSTSLKSLQISMNYPNVMDMPIHHSISDITLEQIPEILEYNLNDVMSTYEFYLQTVKFDKIDLRKKIMAKYGLPCINWNNGKIGENLILKLYCDKTGLKPYNVKKMRSNRLKIALKECIPSIVTFKSKEFNNLLDFYNKKVITETKGSVDYEVIYKGIKYIYGTGGIHAAISPGIYVSDNKYIIKSLDVASLYPNLPIMLEFYIEHLGEDFLEVYRDSIVNIRLAEKAKPKKEQDKAIIDGFKEAANIPYG